MTPTEIFQKQREALRADINEYGIARVPSGSRELPALEGGQPYSWQFYLRAPLMRAHHLSFITRSFWSVYHKRYQARPFQIAGVEAAAVPIMTAIVLGGAAIGLDLNAFTIRKERKTYGLRNLVEGKPNKLPVVLIDDLTSVSHKTIWQAITAVRDEGLPLYQTAFVVVFKGRKDTAPRVLATSLGRVTIESIFTLEDFTLSFEEWKSRGEEEKKTVENRVPRVAPKLVSS